jgi:hypothetical protein
MYILALMIIAMAGTSLCLVQEGTELTKKPRNPVSDLIREFYDSAPLTSPSFGSCTSAVHVS